MERRQDAVGDRLVRTGLQQHLAIEGGEPLARRVLRQSESLVPLGAREEIGQHHRRPGCVEPEVFEGALELDRRGARRNEHRRSTDECGPAGKRGGRQCPLVLVQGGGPDEPDVTTDNHG